jgi:hypothetical protein
MYRERLEEGELPRREFLTYYFCNLGGRMGEKGKPKQAIWHYQNMSKMQKKKKKKKKKTIKRTKKKDDTEMSKEKKENSERWSGTEPP